MNKELIKKYQGEFISWINGKELLIKSSNGWMTIGDDFNWDESTDSIIVLKDKCSEFREPHDSNNLKFKVGDIAIHNGKFRKISKVIDGMLDCFEDGPAVIMSNDTLEIWRPKVGEFCLFSNKGEKPLIGTFLEMFNGDLYVMEECKINAFEFCEPINCAYNCEKAPSHP